jgi:hypothetical protein
MNFSNDLFLEKTNYKVFVFPYRKLHLSVRYGIFLFLVVAYASVFVRLNNCIVFVALNNSCISVQR